MSFLLPCFGLMRRSGGETKVRNLTEGSVEVQIRAGCMVEKAYAVGPGCSKALNRSKIRNNYFNFDGEPYLWIHSSKANFATAKKQYLALDDLQDCNEVIICNDSGKGAFTVIKISRSKAF